MSTWTKRTETTTTVIYETSISGTDTETDILRISPKWFGSFGVKHGGTDALTVSVCMADSPTDATMIVASSDIIIDHEDGWVTPITGLKIAGASTNTHNIFVCIKKLDN